MNVFDGIVIGAGQAGKPLALDLAHAGWKVALVERQFVGGTCVNFGCTPTKTMVASARVAYLARRGPEYGVLVGNVSVDMPKVRSRKRAIVESFRHGSETRIRNEANITFLDGEASFVGPRALDVRLSDGSSTQIMGKRVFINVGCRPAVPSIQGLDTVPWLDSTSIMELESVPEHLLVLGGGYIGVEFGQMFRRFGSQVTIVQRGSQLLSNEDPDVAEAVADIFQQDGIEVLLKTEAIRIEQKDSDLELVIRDGSGQRTLRGSHLLIASGRVPNVEVLQPEVAGVQLDGRGFIRVNEFLETSTPGVFALGDVKGGPAFTHISYDDYRILASNLLKNGRVGIRGRLVPYTVFIDPQLGRVGVTETEARKLGLEVRVAKMPMTWVARALEVDESRGVIKAVLDAQSGRILGCAVLGIEGGELMSLVQVAMMGNLTFSQLRDAIFAHPTLAESLNNLFSGE